MSVLFSGSAEEFADMFNINPQVFEVLGERMILADLVGADANEGS